MGSGPNQPLCAMTIGICHEPGKTGEFINAFNITKMILIRFHCFTVFMISPPERCAVLDLKHNRHQRLEIFGNLGDSRHDHPWNRLDLIVDQLLLSIKRNASGTGIQSNAETLQQIGI